MKLASLSAFVAAVLIAGCNTASADTEYPWCIVTGGVSEGVYSCGYVSLAQCQATRTGTDMCVPNPRYQPASPRGRR